MNPSDARVAQGRPWPDVGAELRVHGGSTEPTERARFASGQTQCKQLLRPLILVASLLMACTAGVEQGPREVTLGVDACEYCHMTVDDPLRAAQWVSGDGRILTFDEPGCLVAWLQRHPDAEGRAFVADAETGEWLSAQDAVYHLGATRTGMGFDIVSYADGADLPTSGELLRWDELLTRGVRDAHAY